MQPLVQKAVAKRSISDLEIGRLLFVLLMGLPVSAILQNVLMNIAKALGLPLRVVSSDGEYKAAVWTDKVLIATEAAWYVFVDWLISRFYGKQDVYLVMITIAILLVWFGNDMMKRFRGYSFVKSLLFDVLDGILELPVLALLSACMLLYYSKMDTMPMFALAMIGVILLVEWLYSKTKLFQSVALFYAFRMICFGICIYMSGYLAGMLPV